MTDDNDKPPESPWREYGLPCLVCGGFGLLCFYLAYVFIHDGEESMLMPPQLMALTSIFFVFGEKYRPILSAIFLVLFGSMLFALSVAGLLKLIRDSKNKK